MKGIEIITMVISMAGGLALFLYGMSMLGSSLEKASSGRMERILQSLTSNILKSVLLGTFVTAAVQSSSATTVIVVGLVNAGILKLSAAVGVIMGANIGTTVTGQLLRLGDLEGGNLSAWMQLIKPTTLAPFVSIVGILIFMASKKDKVKNIGQILLGFGILFSGMFAMEKSISPLAQTEGFQRIFEMFSQNPILGVLAGTIVTALIQSSSASVGILQAISSTGALTFSAAFPIIMGQNIGTCVTPILSSIGANRNAKRAAMVHLYFNVVGTLLFFVGVYLVNALIGLPFWNDSIGRGGIADFHTLFNIVVTALLLPFHSLLEKLATWTIKNTPSKDQETVSEESLLLDDRFLKSPSLAVQQSNNVIVQMAKFAQYNFRESRQLFTKYDQKCVDRIKEYEDAIDRMEDKLSGYLLKVNECELTDAENRDVTALLHMVSEFERIGDYTINIVESAQQLYDGQLKMSDDAIREFSHITNAVDEIIELAVSAAAHSRMETVSYIEPLEETIDQLVDALKSRHIQRFKSGQCSIECGVIFIDILTSLERISDHCSNIAVYITAKHYHSDNLNRHEYIQRLHLGENAQYLNISKEYESKYGSI